MKITRKTLLIITAGLGVFLIVFSLIRQFTGLRLGETFEKNLFDTVLFAALGLFLYNRKLASDERKEREAKERAEREAAQVAAQEAAEAESPAETDRDGPGNEDPCPEKQE